MVNTNNSRGVASDGGHDPTEVGSIDGDTPWPLKEPREVLSKRKVKLPPLAEDRIAGDGETPRVAWNYDPDSGYVFISDNPARKSPYTFADMTEVYNPGDEYPKIRPPDKLPGSMKERFEVPGTFVVYLASEEMLIDENPSAWILSWTQLMRILPNDGGEEEVESLIARNPGFMPSSPF